MYSRHKAAGIIVFIFTAILSYSTEILYDTFAMTVITVASISVAVYIATMSALLGSPYADKLKSIRDSRMKEKSQLGVLATYLQAAGDCGILTVFISSLCQIPAVITVPILLQRLASSIAYGLFAVNLLFLWLIFRFLVTALINSAGN